MRQALINRFKQIFILFSKKNVIFKAFMEDFWLKFKNYRQEKGRPIYALAPMAGITDSAFRQICKKFGADVVYSEMASATALVCQPTKTLEMLKFNRAERPYIVQLFGRKPSHFFQAARLVAEKIKPDGIDINFGCPVKKVTKQGAGAALMDDLPRAREVIKSVIGSTGLPVSIKPRSRAREINILEFLDYVSDLDIKALMIHGRTLAQGFSGQIDFDIIKKARNYFGGIILANGGIDSYDQAVKTLAKTGADGLGIARGALGRPWIFKAVRTGQKVERSSRAIIKIIKKHAELAYKLKGQTGIIEMRKHLCWYVRGWPGARKLRQELIKVENLEGIAKIFSKIGP